SAFGTKRTSRHAQSMFAFGAKDQGVVKCPLLTLNGLVIRSTCLGLYRANFYGEMMCGFHRAERTIERDGGAILQVCLHEDHIGTLARGNLFQRIDRSGSNTPAPMSV